MSRFNAAITVFSTVYCLLSTIYPLNAAELRNFEDAALHAVQFVDEHEGWAVGDEGVVWHTVNGGETWERQPTGVRGSLRSVHFLTPYTGWLAGREELHGGAGSVGILLVTYDGGLKWQRVAMNTMPGLQRVRFIDNKTGFAVGDATDEFPTGVFRTSDGGKTWVPLHGKRLPGWVAGDFQSAKSGVLTGPWGQVAVLANDKLSPAEVDPLGGRMVADVRVMGKWAIAVGQGGLILVSWDSAGSRWSYADAKIIGQVRQDLDFRGLACSGDHVWVVGRPGSFLLHSPDKGESWDMVQTGQPLPLNSVFFANEKFGWAVGEFGSILATKDQGRTWRVQHRGGQRAAILFAHGRPSTLPLDAVALVGGEDGYLSTGLCLFAADPATAALMKASEPQRHAAVVRTAGGAAAETLWQFPFPEHLDSADKTQFVRSWDTMHGERRAAQEFSRQLVLALRTWRPSVVVADQPDAGGTGALLAETLRRAIAQAADDKVFPDQIKELGLEPWSVSKCYVVWNNPKDTQVTYDVTEIAPHLQATPRDFAAKAAALLGETMARSSGVRYFHLLDSTIPGAGQHKDLMQGVELAPGGVARRKQPDVATLSPEQQKAARTLRDLHALVYAPESKLVDAGRSLSQVGPTLATLPDDQAATTAFALARHYADIGQWPYAKEVFLLLTDRYPTHPLAADAYRWLIRLNASSEVRRRYELAQFRVRTKSTIRKAGSADSKELSQRAGFPEDFHGDVPEGVDIRQVDLITNQDDTRQWYQNSLDLGSRMAALGPLFGTDLSSQFCQQAALRQLGQFDKANEWYTRFVAEHTDGPWRDAAAAELWLMNRSGVPPKPVAFCRKISTRPFLDGHLKDGCWETAQSLVLKNAIGNTDTQYPTRAWLAYDKDFLYLALRCQHPKDRFVAPAKSRTRDADLKAFDHVSLLIDLDRDYSTCFRLEVDQRGCVREDCWGDRTWDPRWFVALHSEPDCWRVEAAIPTAELTGDPVTVGKAWACNLVRILPGRGVQAWSLPAGVEPRPEGMGLMIFTQEPNVLGRDSDKPKTKDK
jgi:photosystem II stability/assembly factor-like uncharacterized protein